MCGYQNQENGEVKLFVHEVNWKKSKVENK